MATIEFRDSHGAQFTKATFVVKTVTAIKQLDKAQANASFVMGIDSLESAAGS